MVDVRGVTRHDGLHALCRYRRYRVYWSPRRTSPAGNPAGRAGVDRYSPQVRAELLAMSSATIDRYLRAVKARDQIREIDHQGLPVAAVFDQDPQGNRRGRGISGVLRRRHRRALRSNLKGEFARTVNLTDMHIGWVFTRTERNNAHTHILGALKAGVHEIPYEVTGLDFDNGTEFLNKAVIKWAAQMEIFFTRSRPYKKNDQATIESKNNHLVRKYGFYYRYDTDEERAVLNRLWRLVNDRLNYLTPTIKPALRK